MLLSVVGTQVQGRMEAVGHRQLRADRDVNGVPAASPHVALTTKVERVASEMSQPSPPQPILAPQSKGSKGGKINFKNLVRIF